MKIIHVLPGIPYGGMQRLVAWLAKEQLKLGYDVMVIMINGNNYFINDLQNRNVRYVNLVDKNVIIKMCKLIRVYRQEKPTLLHYHIGNMLISFSILFKSKAICIGHYHTYPSLDSMKLRLLNYLNSKLCDVFIGVSASVCKAINKTIKAPKNSVFMVHNGIEIDQNVIPVRSLRSDTIQNYGMVARLSAEKGGLKFVEFAEEVIKKQPNAQFYIAGTGPLQPAIEDLVIRKNLSKKVHVLGHVIDIENFLKSLDIVVFLSEFEPFGLTILEAMRAGTPIVARLNGSGSDEIINSWFPKFSVAKNDPIEMIIELCFKLSTNRKMWEEISRKNFQTVSNKFTIERFAEEISKVYTQCYQNLKIS